MLNFNAYNRMKKNVLIYFLVFLTSILTGNLCAQNASNNYSQLKNDFIHPPAAAKPWVFWYWMQAAVSKEGITADLEAMKEVGIGGAYLMSIKDTASPQLYRPAARQLSKEWMELVKFAMQEAKRLNLQLGMHVSDGFALAGGPWITPALSMQKVVFSKTIVKGNQLFNQNLLQPETNEGYYKDIAVYAYKNTDTASSNNASTQPIVTSNKPGNYQFLLSLNSKESFKADSNAFIQYQFKTPFTCRSIVIRTNGSNYQAQRLIIQTSNDGVNFKTIKQLESPRHGWQDTDAPVTHSIPNTTAKFFRFLYDKNQSEPGAEDLDNAKWKPNLKISGIELLSSALINQYESKNGEIWRVSKRTDSVEMPTELCVPLKELLNLTNKMVNGKLQWQAPTGTWTIIRIGHTSTKHANETGGAAKGLECDKFNSTAITLQFNSWYGKIYASLGNDLAKKVLTNFHVDSWECGSQNWSTNFLTEFENRRGYSLLPYLPVMAGIPIVSANKSEAVLLDIRQTIAELVNDVFYQTLAKLAHQKGSQFSAESVAPTMMSDGLLHYRSVDLPMGEFWLNSPTHDKPNDMLDAISGAHIYGKNIVQSESFTTLRMSWDEHPGMLKTIGDRNFALGINKMVLHVFTHNPWMNKQPGYTLDGVGLYFQRNQTWFKQAKAWIDYLSRCQLLLQLGKPVVDIAVYTGDELPRRALLPEKLIGSLPGIFGSEKCLSEKKRLQNEAQPLRSIPEGVSHSANMADPEKWVNCLNGYAYDSFNPDALLNLAKVEKGNIVLPGGANYKLLVLPSKHAMNPNNIITDRAVQKIIDLANAGATILLDSSYQQIILKAKLQFKNTNVNGNNLVMAFFGKGKFVLTPYVHNNFTALALDQDLIINSAGVPFNQIAYTHRKITNTDIYFVSNQTAIKKRIELSFRVKNKQPELWDAISGKQIEDIVYQERNGRTELSYLFHENASIFVLFRERIKSVLKSSVKLNATISEKISFNKKWSLQFDTLFGGPSNAILVDSLRDWTSQKDARIKYYSGTVLYSNSFTINQLQNIKLSISSINNIASITVNGKPCGILFTAPFELDISKALQKGINKIEIAVTNTWRNRLIGDHLLPEINRITYTTAPFRLEGKPLSKAGIIGQVELNTY